MRWIVGIDFEDRCGGALHMAAWMREHATNAFRQELVAVHVLPERLRKLIVREATLEAPAMAAAEIRNLVQLSGIGDPFSAIRADWADAPEEGLALAAASPEVTGIIIGRVSGRDATIGRLGRVARRLLRRLPTPVMVVPPDLQRADVGKGPVMLATDLDEASVPAAEMAHTLAAALGRELVVMSADEALYRVVTFSPDGMAPLTLVERRTADEVLAWTRARGLNSVRVQLGEGERVSTLTSIAREHDAALIVCGSRCLSLGERIFASSTASELARRGERAVLVVPARKS
jgi:nucleotide-binding universal stress UspA family protein